MSNIFLQGDALSVLETLPDNYIQCCITSPPYYGLRDYGMIGQIGLEESPEAYIDRLVDVFREVRRVLRHDGIAFVNIGDSYAGSGKGPTGHNGVGNQEQRQGFHSPKVVIPDGLKPKDLIMIPFRLALALQADGWWVRQTIIWNKPNCMPESVTDRCTTSHEYIFLLAKSERYYYDAQAIAEPASYHETRNGRVGAYQNRAIFSIGDGTKPTGTADRELSTRNKRSVWTIPTMPYSEAHFATFPPKLIEPMVLAGSRPGDIVLDPFSGAGTTALVSLQHGRTPLGIELNPEYIKLAQRRVETVQSHLWQSVSDLMEVPS